jgi:hypothetical protein
MRQALKIGLLIILAMTTYAKAEEKLTLKLSLEPKSSYISSMEMNQTITQIVGGEEQKLTQEMLIVWGYNVVSKDKSGVANVTLTYKRIKVNQSYGNQASDYDSDNPPSYLDPSMKGLASLPGTQLTVKLTSEGKVADIKGVDDLINKMLKAMDLPNSPEKAAVIDNLKKQFGAAAMKQSLEQITGFYAKGPIAIGDNWTSEIDMTSGFPMRIISTYTLKSRENRVATIDVSSEIKSDSSIGAMTMGSLKMVYNVTGSQSGTIEADEATGLPTKSTLNLDFAGTVNVSGVPDQESQTWPISATGSVNVSFQKQ